MRRAASVVLAEREAARAQEEASAMEAAARTRATARTRWAPMPSLTIRLPEDVRRAMKERAAEMRTAPSTLARLLVAMGTAVLTR